MADKGVELGSSSAPPQEQGKGKRKLDEPSQQNAANPPPSFTEFPQHESSSQKSPIPSKHLDKTVKGSSSKEVSLAEESESSEWDHPLVRQLEELLMANLHTIFSNAIKKIVDCGYSEDVARKSLSRRGLYHGGKDIVSTIANDTLDLLKKSKGLPLSADYVFEDLQQMVVYTMLEMVHVVREVKPSLSLMETMWRLLISHLNVSQAIAMEGDSCGRKQRLGESSSASSRQQPSDAQSSQTVAIKPNVPNTPKPWLPSAQDNLPQTLKFGSFPVLPNPRNPDASEGLTLKRESASLAAPVKQNISHVSGEKSGSGRKKGRSKKGSSAVQQNSSQVENFKGQGKEASKAGKRTTIGGVVVERKLKANEKGASSRTSAEVGNAASLTDRSHKFSAHTLPGSGDFSAVHTKDYITALPAAHTASPASSHSEKKPALKPETNASVSSDMPNYYAGIPYDESLGKYVPRDKKDEMILKLVPWKQELENELEFWNEWANQKVMQAAHRLSEDQPELKALRREKEEAEKLKKEKQNFEINSSKRLAEMEFALRSTTKQIERAKSTARELDVEQVVLKKEMEAARLHAAESAVNCEEAKERERKALKDAQPLEGQKALLQEELESLKRKRAELQREVDKAKNRESQVEARWNLERVAVENTLAQAASIRKEREQVEAAGKAEEERMKLKAKNDMQRCMEDIKKLEQEVSKLKLKSESSKIAALKEGMERSYGGGKPDSKNKNVATPNIKQDRECVMCLTEEKRVIFLPCAHQILCTNCNELHEKEGMKDCPSCRAPIQMRFHPRFARP